jgi:hypothetical protein
MFQLVQLPSQVGATGTTFESLLPTGFHHPTHRRSSARISGKRVPLNKVVTVTTGETFVPAGGGIRVAHHVRLRSTSEVSTRKSDVALLVEVQPVRTCRFLDEQSVMERPTGQSREGSRRWQRSAVDSPQVA